MRSDIFNSEKCRLSFDAENLSVGNADKGKHE